MKFQPGKIIEVFTAKNGEKVYLRYPRWEDWKQLLRFINSLIEEKAKISKIKRVRKKEEIEYIKKVLEECEKDERVQILAEINKKIVGSCEIKKSKSEVNQHIGNLGVSVLKGYRGIGIGKKLLQTCMEKAKEIGIEIVTLDVYADNERAIKIYKKLGFKEFGRLKRGIKREGKYIDNI